MKKKTTTKRVAHVETALTFLEQHVATMPTSLIGESINFILNHTMDGLSESKRSKVIDRILRIANARRDAITLPAGTTFAQMKAMTLEGQEFMPPGTDGLATDYLLLPLLNLCCGFNSKGARNLIQQITGIVCDEDTDPVLRDELIRGTNIVSVFHTGAEVFRRVNVEEHFRPYYEDTLEDEGHSA